MPTVRYTVANGQIIAEKRTVRRFYQTDALGSVIGLFDSNQIKTDSATYWPYGGTRTSSGTFGSKMGFVGSWGCRKQIDGDIYMRARVHEPKDGRWLTVDPWWPWEQSFGCCGQNPSTIIDPTGAQLKEINPGPPEKRHYCDSLLSKHEVGLQKGLELVKCSLECAEKEGKSRLACIAECLLKLGIGVGKQDLLRYYCCLMFARFVEVRGKDRRYIDPCTNPDDILCCDSRFCACVMDQGGSWESIANGMCPAKVVLNCRDEAEKECGMTGYVAPPFEHL